MVNLFLKDSVDDKVYGALRRRCGLFEHFVGPMQPVLARARRMLLNQEPLDLSALQTAAAEVERDPLAAEIYLENDAAEAGGAKAALARDDLVEALAELSDDVGLSVHKGPDGEVFTLSGLQGGRVKLAATVQALEHNRSARPLSLLEPALAALRDKLQRPGERLPLVVESVQDGPFRVSVALRVHSDGTPTPVETLAELRTRMAAWDGLYPEPAAWQQAKQHAQQLAATRARELKTRALQCQTACRQRQLPAARIRLQRELGRFLVAVDERANDLNDLLYQQTTRDIATAGRLRRCLERLGGYPSWDSQLREELTNFTKTLTDNSWKARLWGRELDAALNDPRWQANG